MTRSRSNSESESRLIEVDEELKVYYKEAFDDFDWNRNGRITCGVRPFICISYSKNISIIVQDVNKHMMLKSREAKNA